MVLSLAAQFPRELMDEILGHHAEDSACLKACSLVCRAWFLSSRSLLFKTCILSPTNIRRFRDLLRSPGCTILPHVRTLDVYRNWFNADDGCFNEVAEDLRHLTHIHTLHLGLRMDPHVLKAHQDAFFRTGFVTAFPQITTLTLTCDYGGGGSPSASAPLFDMLCLFPALQELQSCRWRYGGGLDSAVAAPSGDLPNLDSVTLPRVPPPDVQIVRTTLLQLGNTLHHLTIELMRSRRSCGDIADVFDLSLHRNLRTLFIRDSTRGSPAQFNPTPILTVIRRLAAPALESVSLDLNLRLYHDLDWALLDAFLSLARFPRLRKVVFQCRHNDDRVFLRKVLPALEDSGMLTI
ncbi:hypothetical protein K438DRAFT_1965689 [Mycena galopus ATCC 62051]|nr:hypothetical protein K438DRAFT_1965689 [Mycena galopus ATCC 62051]